MYVFTKLIVAQTLKVVLLIQLLPQQDFLTDFLTRYEDPAGGSEGVDYEVKRFQKTHLSIGKQFS